MRIAEKLENKLRTGLRAASRPACAALEMFASVWPIAFVSGDAHIDFASCEFGRAELSRCGGPVAAHV